MTNYYAKKQESSKVSDDQLLVGRKWENVELSFSSIPIKLFPFP